MTYRANDFEWKNQTITKLVFSLFKIQNDYLPELSYNSRVREVLDRFEPRALYFCDPNYFDEDNQQQYKHFDICSSYSNVLLKNK